MPGKMSYTNDILQLGVVFNERVKYNIKFKIILYLI